MSYSVYILYSQKLNRYYTGTTDNIEERLLEHNSGKYEDAFTIRGIPWELVFAIDQLNSKQAFAIEAHIKKMKSVVYMMNLIKYPEMRQKLIDKYK